VYTLRTYRLILVVFTLLATSLSFGQGEDLAKANELFNNGEYTKAKDLYSSLLAFDETNADLNFKFGACLLYTEEDKVTGLGRLQFSLKDPNVDPRAHYFLGKAYHLNYRFKEAISAYKRFKSNGSAKDFENLNVDQEIQMCQNGRKLLKNLSELVVLEKKEVIEARIQYSYDLSNIGGKILVTDEFQSKYDKKLGHRPLVHFPSTRQDNIFYSSYGKDGKTGRDLYQIKKLPNGKWAEPQKLPAQVNTNSDDDYGFLHPDGKTFYFCSKGHSSMGGYDVFRCAYDRDYNSFGPAVNMDFKINTPDDDFLYIVDSLNKEAYFSSSRSSQGGYMDVYHVKVEIYPVLNAIIAGTFKNTITPSNKGVVIKVKDVVRDEIIGVYNSKNEDGRFVIILPKSGKYQYIVESPETDEVHTGLFEVPYQKTLRPLKQHLTLINEADEERLLIQNLFNEDVEDNDSIMADVLKKISDVDVNFNTLEPLTDSAQNEAIDSAGIDDMTPESLVALADTMAAETAREAAEIKQKRDAALFTANEKMKSAKENAQKAEEVLAGIENITNPSEKQQLIDVAEEYHQKAKEDNAVATGALNLGNVLDEQFKEKEKEAEQADTYAKEIKSALDSSDPQDAIAKLKALQDYIEEARTIDVNKKNEFDKIKAAAKDKQDEATDALARATSLRNDEDDLNVELKNLEMKLNLAKKGDRAAIEIQIQDTKDEIAQVEKDAVKAFAHARAVQKDADILNEQADVLGRLFDDLAVIEAQELTPEERAALESEMNSGAITSSIDKTDGILANNQPAASVDTTTGPVTNPDFESQLNSILANSTLGETDSIKESFSSMPDGPEKAELENQANKDGIEKIKEDIDIIDQAIAIETDPGKKEDLQNKKDELRLEETKMNDEIAQNDEVIKSGTNVDPDPIGSIVNEENYNDLKAEESRTDDITDPIEQAIAKEKNADKWISELTDDITKLEEEAAKESDPLKQAEMFDKAEGLKVDLEAKNDEKNKWAEIASSTPDTGPKSWEIDETKYDDYQTKSDGLAGITDPVDRAHAERGLKKEWVDDIDKDLRGLESALESAPENEKPEIQNQIDVLTLQKTQLEDEIASSDEVIAAGTVIDPPDTTSGPTAEESTAKANDVKNTSNLFITESDDKLAGAINEVVGDGTPKSKALGENEVYISHKEDLITEKDRLETELNGTEDPIVQAALMNAISEVDQGISDVDLKIESNQEIINKGEIASAGVSPDPDFSYTEEPTFKSAGAKDKYDGVKSEVEELNDDQLKLAALQLEAETAEGGKLEKINKDITKVEEDIIENEIKLAPTFAEINQDEKAELTKKIEDSKELISGSEFDGTTVMIKNDDDLAGVDSGFKEAASLRAKAAETEDDKEKNDLLKTAAAIEKNALDQLKTVAENVDGIASQVEVASTVVTDENPVNPVGPVAADENASLSNTEIYESSTAISALEPIKADLTKIDGYNTQIEELDVQKEGASEKEIAKLDKKISKIETKRAKVEAKVAPQIAAANSAEFDHNQNVADETKADFNKVASVGGSNTALEDANTHQKTAADQFIEAEELRITAAGTKSKTEKNDMLKKADGLEKAAIKNMDAANSLFAEAAKTAAQQKYPRLGADVPTDVEERASTKQRNMALTLAEESEAMLAESKMLADSSVNLKNQNAKNMLLSESEELKAMGIMKKDLSDVLLYSSDDLAEDEAKIIKDQELIAGMSDADANAALQSKEYKEAYDLFIKDMESIEADILDVESLQDALVEGAKEDRADARDLHQIAQLSNDPVEKANFINKANDALARAIDKEAQADSLAEIIDGYVENKNDLRTKQYEHLEKVPNSSLASTIEAISISDLDKEPVVATLGYDSTQIASATFEAPDSVRQDIVVIGNTDAPSYNEENPIPLNPKMPDGLVYRVQVGAFRKPIPQDLFKGFAPITGEKVKDDITRYRVGYFVGYETANNAKNEIRGIGYPDAFVVALYNGKFIGLAEAKRKERDGDGVASNLLAANVDPDPTRTDPDPTRTDPDPTRTDPDPTRTDPDPTRTDPDPTRTDPDPTRTTNYYDSLKNAPDAQPIEVVQGLFYTVQIGAYSKEVRSRDLFNVQPLNVKQAPNGLLRYSTGRYRNIPDASARKNEIRTIGITDAFVTVYYNGKRITFAEGERLIAEQGDAVYAVDGAGTTRLLDPPSSNNGVEGLEYVVDLGTFDGGVPSGIARAILPHGDLINREFKDSSVLIMTSGPMTTFKLANDRKKLFQNDGVSNVGMRAIYNGEEISIEEAKALESGGASVDPPSNTTPSPVNGLMFRVHLGNYTDGVPVTRSGVFISKQDETAPVESIEETDGSATYYCGKSDYLAEAEENQRIFATAGISNAKVVAFYNGSEISLEDAIKMTLE